MSQLEKPSSLFKYVSPARVDILEKLSIRFTQPSCFNDPFEARFCLEGLEDPGIMTRFLDIATRRHYRAYVLRQPFGCKPMSFDAFQRIEAEHNKAGLDQLKRAPRLTKDRVGRNAQKFWDQIGILSLSATGNSVLMWAHYTSAHEGMVIEFDTNNPFFPISPSAEIKLGTLVQVDYSKKRPRHPLGEVVPPEFFTIKSDEWAYEHEWRVFQPLENSDFILEPGVHLFAIPADAIKRVICGYRMTDESRDRIAEAVRKDPKLRHVKIHHCSPDTESFRFVYTRSRPLKPRTIGV